jgi:uncharacterized protein (TIGR00725 family)
MLGGGPGRARHLPKVGKNLPSIAVRDRVGLRGILRIVRRVVAVCGPGGDAVDDDVLRLAHEVGARLAEAGAVVVTGGLDGVMAAASHGAQQAGGRTVGLLPGTDAATGNEYLTVAVPTGVGQLRNGLVVNAADAVIAIGGSWGTLSEIALARRANKPVVVIRGWQVLDETGRTLPAVTADSAEKAVAMLTDALQ